MKKKEKSIVQHLLDSH